MSDRSVVFWCIAGFPIAVVDAWLSIQSMFGLIGPISFIGYSIAILSGILLTAFAVYVPILRGRNTSPILVMIWLAAFVFDLTTSIIGAIWYGAIGMPLSSTVELSGLYFEPSNWLLTLSFSLFVLVFAGCCFKFGQALNILNQRRNQWREARVSDRTSRYTRIRQRDLDER